MTRDCSNSIKICLDSSSRILESCYLMSLWLFCWWLWTSLCPVCLVSRKTIFCSCGMFFLKSTLFCFSLEYCWFFYLVFIPIVPCQYEQVLPNLSSFDQPTVSSSLRKLAKPKKSEKHSRSFVWKLISKRGFVLVVFICAK